MAFKVFIFFSLAFRAAIYSQLRHSKLSFSVQRLEASFLVSTFRATISFRFGVWSHHPFSIWVFRATISSQFGHLEPPSLFNLAFRVTIPSQFGVQSHHSIIIRHSLPPFRRSQLHSWHSESSLTVRLSELHSWHSEPLFTVWRSELSFTVWSSELHSWHSKPLFIVYNSESLSIPEV